MKLLWRKFTQKMLLEMPKRRWIYKEELISVPQTQLLSYTKKKESLINTTYWNRNISFCDYDESLYGETPSLMTGSIDLLLEKDGKALIVDYKTDTNHFENNDEFEKALIQKYSEQLNIYKKIISKCKGIPNENIELKIVWLEEKDDKTFAHFIKI